MNCIVGAVMVAALLAAAGPLTAQQGIPLSDGAQLEMAKRVPATVVLVHDLPAPDAAAVILRRPAESPHDVILLRNTTANGARLAAAVAYLGVVRDRSGDTATTQGLFRVPEHAFPSALNQRNERTAAGVVARLRGSEARDIPGVGRAPAREIYSPSKAMRDAQRVSRESGAAQ